MLDIIWTYEKVSLNQSDTYITKHYKIWILHKNTVTNYYHEYTIKYIMINSS
jgi:hypothetical protein